MPIYFSWFITALLSVSGDLQQSQPTAKWAPFILREIATQLPLLFSPIDSLPRKRMLYSAIDGSAGSILHLRCYDRSNRSCIPRTPPVRAYAGDCMVAFRLCPSHFRNHRGLHFVPAHCVGSGPQKDN